MLSGVLSTATESTYIHAETINTVKVWMAQQQSPNYQGTEEYCALGAEFEISACPAETAPL